jgi:hypothetical protein
MFSQLADHGSLFAMKVFTSFSNKIFLSEPCVYLVLEKQKAPSKEGAFRYLKRLSVVDMGLLNDYEMSPT